MLRKFAVELNARMNANGVTAPSVDVIHYALQIVTNTVGISALSLLIGLLTGQFVQTLVTLLFFAVIRVLTGGYHLKSGFWCIVVSTAVMSGIPHIVLNTGWTYTLTAAALAVVLLLAPANYDKYARISPKYYPHLKIAASVVVSLNFFIVSDTIALAYITAAALLPFKEGGQAE